MKNRFRLARTDYARETEEQKIEPQKIFYLSVEGNVTEQQYFAGISKYREELGINGRIDVEILSRSSRDTYSAPKYVLELLEEYLRLRELGQERMIEEIPVDIAKAYGEEFIRTYLENPQHLPKKERSRFVQDLRKAGYDINYRKFLSTYKNKGDEFWILIDRDSQAHTEKEITECIEHCKKSGYHCYISNPCFEFWLLLHLSDVKEEYQSQMDKIQENKKVSHRHTFVSREVTRRAHHGKGGLNFEKNYLPHVLEAAERAKAFEQDDSRLAGCVGCNLWKLIGILRDF